MWCFVCSTTSAGSARLAAALIYALSALITGPGLAVWAATRARGQASPNAVIAEMRRTLRRLTLFPNWRVNLEPWVVPADAEGKLSPKALPIQKLEYRGVRYAEPGFMIPANSM